MVAGGPLAGLTCHAFDPRPFRIGDRHHRQPRDADQRKVLEGCVCLDFGERDRPRKPLDRCDIHRDVLSARVLRIRISVGQRLHDPDHRLLITGVIVEDAVALLDGAKMLLRQRVPDAAPDRFLVLHERAESVVGRFFLHQPVHSPRIVASHVSGFGPLWLSLAATSLGSGDRKSTRLNSSHLVISYAVFCLKKKSTRLNSSHLVISYDVLCLKKKKKYVKLLFIHYYLENKNLT